MTTEQRLLELAERERVEGYRDGWDPDNPEPSANRSASYRHGFECARSDLRHEPAFGGAQHAREHADRAEREDARAQGTTNNG